MKKDFISVFNNDTSIDEYQLDNLLDKNIEIKENEFPTILVDKEDDTSKYININNNSNINLNEKIEDNIINTIETNEINETENITNENDLSDAYTEEENNLYNDTENNISLTEDDLTDIEDVEEFNLEDAVFGSSDNDIYKNNSEKFNININDIDNVGDMKEIDLMEEDNLKKENEILDYEDKEVVVPSVDNADYIDESDYINDINSDSEIVEMSGNELDLLTKDKDINEDKENILEALGNNMRKDNFLLEEQTIENNNAEDNFASADSQINKEEEEQKRTEYYINKFKKMYEDYIKSLQEKKEEEKNKESKIKKEAEEKLNNGDIIEDISEDIKEEEKTEDYITKFKKMHEDYIKSLQEKEEEKNKVNDEVSDNSNITDELSAEEEKMYRDYLGEDAYLIEDEESEEINSEYTPLEIAKNELKKKEEALSKLEIIGELSAEEESIFDDILRQNKNKYYEDDINNADIILKELNLDEIKEINEDDFNILENFILGKEPEDGIELISIKEDKDKKNNDNNVNRLISMGDFDSIDIDELSKEKEYIMPKEKELYETEKENVDLNAKVEEEFSLNNDDSVLINEKVDKNEDNKDDFDGEITQLDLDLAEKLFEREDTKNSVDYGPKHDLLLSENDINKFRKLFSYFKNIVEKLPKEHLNEFSKTEFYDIYSNLFRKFGE
ncbi:hypothetical protein [Brachyspira catarrhinii]|uniref:Viral A-type inclusion protein n=1 Tax=Brachyspira catarrhinii TaxID=2528966 RepID=A0ABY2TR25_9SPIR|nr:hypothetical protein [Brachyspira catarrhinii]TKZ33919.1 hypothetical protein EZH24_08160 [Brachyspira catarrhinii]